MGPRPDIPAEVQITDDELRTGWFVPNSGVAGSAAAGAESIADVVAPSARTLADTQTISVLAAVRTIPKM